MQQNDVTEATSTSGDFSEIVEHITKLPSRLQVPPLTLSVLSSNQRASLTSRAVALLSSKTAQASCTTSGGITNPVGAQNRTLSRATAHSPESRNPRKHDENAIAHWAPEPERQSVAAARKHAIAELRLEMSIEPDDELAQIAGLPSRTLALQWIECLQRDLWSA